MASFISASAKMRRAIATADKVHKRLAALREALEFLKTDTRFVDLLRAHHIETLPAALADIAVQAQEIAFQSDLRRRTADLLGGGLNKRSHALLKKLTPDRRIVVAESMLFISDVSEHYVRSLVLATRRDGRIDTAPVGYRRAYRYELPLLTEESERLHRHCKCALSSLGSNSLALVAGIAFARRLLTLPKLSHKLSQRHPVALGKLRRVRLLCANSVHGPLDREKCSLSAH